MLQRIPRKSVTAGQLQQVQAHKYKHTNTSTQIQVHKYNHTSASPLVQAHALAKAPTRHQRNIDCLYIAIFIYFNTHIYIYMHVYRYV